MLLASLPEFRSQLIVAFRYILSRIRLGFCSLVGDIVSIHYV